MKIVFICFFSLLTSTGGLEITHSHPYPKVFHLLLTWLFCKHRLLDSTIGFYFVIVINFNITYVIQICNCIYVLERIGCLWLTFLQKCLGEFWSKNNSITTRMGCMGQLDILVSEQLFMRVSSWSMLKWFGAYEPLGRIHVNMMIGASKILFSHFYTSISMFNSEIIHLKNSVVQMTCPTLVCSFETISLESIVSIFIRN